MTRASLRWLLRRLWLLCPWQLLRGFVTACLVGGSLGAAAAEPVLPAYLQRQWSSWLLEAYDRPDEVMTRLQAVAVDPEQRTWHRFATARLSMLRGDWPAAAALYPSPPPADASASALQVYALLAEREGDKVQALALVERVWALVLPGCRVGAVAAVSPAPVPPAELPQCAFWLAQEASQLRTRLLRDAGQIASARAQVAQSLVLMRAVRHVDLEAGLLNDAAVVELRDDKASAAEAFLAQGLALDGISARMRARLINSQAAIAQQRGLRDEQGRLLEAALMFAQRAEAVRTVAVLQANLADFHISQGRTAQARTLAQAALPVLVRFRDLTAESLARHNLSLALIGERDFAGAREQLARVAALPPGSDARRAEALRELGLAWAKAGQAPEALAVYHAERKLTQAAQARARDAALTEVRTRLGSSAQEAKLLLLQREAQVQEQTLSNQASLRWVGVAGMVLVVLSLSLGGVLLVRNRLAHRALRHNQSLLQTLSERDPLTQLSNRRQFHKAMSRRADEPFEGTVVLVDIDHFKRINDEHGHSVGDAVIRAFAQRLQRAVRDGDLVVRWGGEEFLIYAPSLKVLHARAWIERLMPSLNSTPVSLPDGRHLDVTCSMGFLTLPLPPLGVRFTWERAVHWADLALYAAKNRGRRRALGLVGVHVSDEISLAQVEADFEGAASAARLSVVQILATA